MRSMGIIVYPDGSMAEIFEVELSYPVIKRLKHPQPGVPVPPQ